MSSPTTQNSHKRNWANIGALLGGLAALITALVTLLAFFTNDGDETDTTPVESTPVEVTTTSNGITTPTTTQPETATAVTQPPVTQPPVTTAPMTTQPTPEIRILTPRDGEVGPRGVEVSGTVQPVDTDVWISVQGSSSTGVFFVGGFPVRAGSDGTWSALPVIGATSDEGFTFTITAYAMDASSSQILEDRDFGSDVNQLVPLVEIPPALDVDQVDYTRE